MASVKFYFDIQLAPLITLNSDIAWATYLFAP